MCILFNSQILIFFDDKIKRDKNYIIKYFI